MSDVQMMAEAPVQQVEIPGTAETVAPANLDDVLSNIYDREVTQNGSDRGDDGKFVSPNPETPESPAAEEASVQSEPGEGEEQTQESQTLTPAEVPLPSSWRDKADAWAKVPADVKPWLAEHDARTNQTLSEQGRTIATLRPVQDVIKANEHLFNGRTKPDGSRVSAHEAIAFLFDAQAKLDQNPVQALIGIAKSYGADGALAQALGVKDYKPQPTQAQQPQISPDLLKRIVADTFEEKFSEKSTIDGNTKLYNDFAAKNPLVSEIATEDLLQFIEIAKTKVSDTAAPSAVLEKAYDMAVHADPSLRAKVAAAAKAAAVTPQNPQRAEDAKRANAVNLKSTSTGKVKPPSLDDVLSQTYDRAQESRK
jgi:hypothetical protein